MMYNKEKDEEMFNRYENMKCVYILIVNYTHTHTQDVLCRFSLSSSEIFMYVQEHERRKKAHSFISQNQKD